jgi:Tfp pilus assembly protein FimT
MLELAVTVSVAGLSLAVSIPAIAPLLQSNNLTAAADQVAGHLRLARQMAVSDGVPRIVFWDADEQMYNIARDTNGNDQVDNGETTYGPFSLPDHICWTTPSQDGLAGTQLTFSRQGGASQSGRVIFQNPRGQSLGLLLLGPTGQVKIQKA